MLMTDGILRQGCWGVINWGNIVYVRRQPVHCPCGPSTLRVVGLVLRRVVLREVKIYYT